MIKQRVTAQKRNRIFLCFKNDLPATQAADICGVNRNTVNRYYNLRRSARSREARPWSGEKVFVTVVPDCSRESLMPVIRGLILEHSTIYTDGWKAYDGIENFWSFAKRRLAKFNGCDSDKFVLHLKECEWRYKHRHEDLLPLVKKLFKKTYLD